MVIVSEHAWESTLVSSGGGVSFSKNTLVRLLLSVDSFLILVSTGLLAYFVRPSETPLILHYNVYFGVDLVGIWWQAYVLPVLGIVFLLGHFFGAKRFYDQKERIAAYLLLLSATMLSFGILVACIGMAFINY